MNQTLMQSEMGGTQCMLAAARCGDEKAFMALVSPLAPSLQRLANRYSRNTADADDICQESLLKAYVKLDQFSSTQQLVTNEFHAWLMKIAANSAIDFLRRKHSKRLVPLDESNHVPNKPHEAGAGGWGENPERALVRQERRSLMAEAITRLPVELRRVCLLRDVMELSTKEVAAKLGISTTAVRLRLFRAHGLLRKNLGGKTSACVSDSSLASAAEFEKSRDEARLQNDRRQSAQRQRNRSQVAGRQDSAQVLPRYQLQESCACGD
jgi:RNA polymerase sigma factor (sigma-70 family)